MSHNLTATFGATVTRWRRLMSTAMTLASQQQTFEPLNTSGLVAHCDHLFPEDGVWRRQWLDLMARVPTATAFHDPDWQELDWRLFGEPKALRLIRVFDGDRLAAVLPLRTCDGAIESTGTRLGDYLDPLIDPACAEECWDAIFPMLRRIGGGEPVRLHHVREDWPCRASLPRFGIKHGFTLSETAAEGAPRVMLPDSYEAWIASLSPSTRHSTRQKVSKALRNGRARLETLCPHADDQTIETTLQQTFELMAARGGHKAFNVGARMKPLLSQLGPDLVRRGRIRIQTLYIEDRIAAVGVHMEMTCSDGPMFYTNGYDPEMSKWSPGIVLIALGIKDAIERKARTYDFMRGRENYKYHFGAVDRILYTIELRCT
jgi:CelD/BcsL family acetyltransferase involved in cellulose biosynthesis